MTLLSLVIGIVISFFLSHKLKKKSGQLFGLLSKACVIGVGFGLHVEDLQVVDLPRIGMIVGGIGITIVAGYFLGRLMRMSASMATLITVGTAICGGSAIATVAPLIRAKRRDVVVALASIFLLNSVAIIIFPVVGRAVGLSDSMFGLWAGIAIHDTSSVIGAASIFSEASLKIAVIIKAIRTLFIVPIAIGISVLSRRKSEPTGFPWFLGIFLIAIGVVQFLPAGEPFFHMVYSVSKQMTVVPIFLLGTSFSAKETEEGGVKPLVFASVLWVTVAVAVLGVIFLTKVHQRPSWGPPHPALRAPLSTHFVRREGLSDILRTDRYPSVQINTNITSSPSLLT